MCELFKSNLKSTVLVLPECVLESVLTVLSQCLLQFVTTNKVITIVAYFKFINSMGVSKIFPKWLPDLAVRYRDLGLCSQPLTDLESASNLLDF